MMGSVLPTNGVNQQQEGSLFKNKGSSLANKAEQAAQRFEGMLWNEVAQAMSAVHLGPSGLGNAGNIYERMMWRRIAMHDFNGADHRLTAAIMRQLGIKTPPSEGGGYTGLPTQDGVIDRNSAAMPASVAALALNAPSEKPLTTMPTHPMNTGSDPASWVQDIWSAIKEGAQALGVPAKALLAQAALETGWGSSAPGHNLFGVKAHGTTAGITAPTHEFTDGVYRQVQATFASYLSPTHAVADFVKVLQNAHPKAVGQTTVAGYAKALQTSGYATDPRYAAKIEAVARSPRMQNLLRSVEE